MKRFFSFPNPVNDKAARTVAAVVLIEVIVILATGWYWLTIPLAYGFWARVLTGPKLSPLGWTAMNVIAPRLGDKVYVPGPPKRFAQAMGTVMASLALLFGLILGDHTAAAVVLVLFIPAAGLESIFGYCLGCKAFALLMRDRADPRGGLRGVRGHLAAARGRPVLRPFQPCRWSRWTPARAPLSAGRVVKRRSAQDVVL